MREWGGASCISSKPPPCLIYDTPCPPTPCLTMPRLSRPRRKQKTSLSEAGQGGKAGSDGCADGKQRRGASRFASVSVEDMDAGGRSKWPQAFWVLLSPPGHPNKRRLMTVQDFFRYTEEEGESGCLWVPAGPEEQ